MGPSVRYAGADEAIRSKVRGRFMPKIKTKAGLISINRRGEISLPFSGKIMEPKTVKLSVLGGVLYVDKVPQGVSVEVQEHDNKEAYVIRGLGDGSQQEEKINYSKSEEN